MSGPLMGAAVGVAAVFGAAIGVACGKEGRKFSRYRENLVYRPAAWRERQSPRRCGEAAVRLFRRSRTVWPRAERSRHRDRSTSGSVDACSTRIRFCAVLEVEAE